MASILTNELKNGTRLLLDNIPFYIIDTTFVKPGKGQAFNRVKLKNLLNGRVIDKTFKSGESLELADVVEIEAQFLYKDDDQSHFMCVGNYEQITADNSAISDNLKWLKEEANYVLTLWNSQIISVTPPNSIELEIVETDAGIKGDTAQGGTKPATLSTGAVIRVPLFLNIGEIIKIDTRNAEYISRA